MKNLTGNVIWMIDGSRQIVVSEKSKYVMTDNSKKIMKTNINVQPMTKILVELGDGIREFA